MRESLKELLDKTLIWEYSLPDDKIDIDAVSISTWKCLSMFKLVINSIFKQYSF